MKGLDLSKFKKVASDDKKTVFKHADGHFLHIQHKNVTPTVKRNLAKLPTQKFEDGGSVLDKNMEAALAGEGETSEPQMSVPPPQAPAFDASAMDLAAQKAPVAPILNAAPAEPEGGGIPAAPMQQMELGTNNPTPDAQQLPADLNGPGGLQQMQNAVTAKGNAEAKLGDQNAKTLGDFQQQQVTQDQVNQSVDATYDKEHNALVQDALNGHIDPNRYFKSLGTGGKIATAIGLALSGLGGIATHGRNLAIDAINDNINRDIDAQKSDLTNKHNMLSAMENHYGHKLTARAATHAFGLEMVKAKIDEAAAKAQSPMAKANAQYMNGMIQNQIDQIGMQNKQQMAVVAGLHAGTVTPEQAVTQLVPKEHQAKAFEEVGKAQDTAKVAGSLMTSFDEGAKENTLLRTGGGMLRTPQSKIKYNALMLPLIHDKEGRVNEFEQKTTENMFPAPGDTDKKIAQKRLGLQQFIDGKSATPTFSGYLPGYKFNKPENR